MHNQNGTSTIQGVNLSATSVIGTPVVNAQNEDLGEIKEIMLDTKHGKISYVVLSFGGFLGLGDKLFAIPMDAFTVDTENEKFILNVDKEKLKSAPGFDKDNWPGTADYKYHEEVYNYYNVKPYWTK